MARWVKGEKKDGIRKEMEQGGNQEECRPLPNKSKLKMIAEMQNKNISVKSINQTKQIARRYHLLLEI